MLVHHFLENSSDRHPDKVAVLHGESTYDYHQVECKANSIANWLIQLGIKRGDRVALLLRNSIDYICTYYGVLKTGAIAVPLNTGLSPAELAQMIDDCSPRVLLSERFFGEMVAACLEDKSTRIEVTLLTDRRQKDGEKPPWLDINIEDIVNTYSSDRPKVTLIDKDVAAIIYTSGSMGKPKGATLTHLNIVTNTRSIVSYLNLCSSDRIMVVLPFYYVYGKSLLNTHFFVSGSVVLENRFMFPDLVLKSMINAEATGFSGVPSTFSILLNRSSIRKMVFPSLRYITQAGGHMTTTVKERLLEIFSTKEIYIMYGATEASARLSYLEPRFLRNRLASVGRAIPNVEIDIIDASGYPVEPGIEGEIIARGSNIMQGYWNAPQETDAVLKNGWYYTGDLGLKDSDGFLYVTGRKKDMIKSGLHKFSAKEIEEVLHAHPDIEEAAVIPIPDAVLGEAAHAFIVAGLTLDMNELKSFLKQHLDDYKMPKGVNRIDELPKNESGKVLKQKLKEMI